MRAVIYSRFSNLEQGKGHSLARQLGDCRAHITRHGWTATGEEICDEGRSAYSGANLDGGALGAFEARVTTGHYGAGHVLVVERLDRLSRRDATQVWRWLDRVTSAGMSIATVDGDVLYRANTPLDMSEILTMVLKSSLAFEESEKKSQRSRAVLAHKRDGLASGRLMTSRVPAWLTVRDGVIEPIEHRTAVVRRIFEMADQGAGRGTIAKRLNADKVTGFASGTWSLQYVQKILTNPATLGDYQPMSKTTGTRIAVGDVVRGYYPAIIAADQFARVNDIRANRAKKTMGIKGDAIVNIFSGLAKCAACGGRATYMNRTLADNIIIKKYLVCDRSRRGTCGDKRRYSYDRVLNRTLDLVLMISLNDAHFTAPADINRLETRIAELERSHDDARRKADAALELYLEMPREAVKARYDGLEREVETIAADIVTAQAELAEARGTVAPSAHRERVKTMRALLDDADAETRLSARVRVMAALRATVTTMTLAGGRITVTVPGATISYAVAGDPAHEFAYETTGDEARAGWLESIAA